MTANFVDQFGFNDEEFTDHDDSIGWLNLNYPLCNSNSFGIVDRGSDECMNEFFSGQLLTE